MSSERLDMPVSPAMVAFKNDCQKYFVCYVFAVAGLAKEAAWFASLNPERDKELLVGAGAHPDDGIVQASIKIGDMLDHSARGGAFGGMIAQAFIVAIYAVWEEVYRPMVAKEQGVEKNAISCDLMGDVRLVRNCIVHRRSIVKNEGSKLRLLRWTLPPGPLEISDEMLRVFIDQVNTMQARVVPIPGPTACCTPRSRP
jgi:hypothetical protein